MNAHLPAYGDQKPSAPTVGGVFADYSSRPAWRIGKGFSSLVTPGRRTPSALERPVNERAGADSANRHDGNILLLHPGLLGADDIEILGRLSQLGVRFPLTTVGAGAPAAPPDEETRKELVERLQFIVELLKSGGAAADPEPTSAKVLERQNLRLDFKTCQAFWKNQVVNLTITEFNIVSLFAARLGENLSYREIYDIVHGVGFCAGDGATGYQTNVRSLIKRIRQKFNALDGGFDEIENHRGYGYRWRDCGGEPAVRETASADALHPASPDVEAGETGSEPNTNYAPTHLLMVCLVNAPAAI